MLISNETGAFVVICTYDGEISNVLRDDLGLARRAGTSLHHIVDDFSRPKLEQFLERLKNEETVVDWEVNVLHEQGLRPVRFAGIVNNGVILVIAARSSSEVRSVCEALTAINNEQTNALRMALKELALRSQQGPVDEERLLYDELSRLNNELVTTQRELVRKNHELARANGMKTRFLGMASHDLRKPLSVILMYFDILVANHQDVLSEDDQKLIDVIDSSLQEMIARINEFLDIGQIESGSMKLKLGITDIARLMTGRVAVHRDLAASRNMTINFTEPEQKVVISVDSSRIKAVIDNLLDNAVKYSPNGSTIDVTMEILPDHVHIAIADEGPGIPVAEQRTLFNLYSRADINPANGERSIGLGLAICKALVTAHGGDIWLDQDVPRGTTVHFTLPLQQALF